VTDVPHADDRPAPLLGASSRHRGALDGHDERPVWKQPRGGDGGGANEADLLGAGEQPEDVRVRLLLRKLIERPQDREPPAEVVAGTGVEDGAADARGLDVPEREVAHRGGGTRRERRLRGDEALRPARWRVAESGRGDDGG